MSYASTHEDMYNSKELWPREDGNDGRTVRLIQRLLDLALMLEDKPVLVLAYNYAVCDMIAVMIEEAAYARKVYFEYSRIKNSAVLHDTDIRFLSSQSDSISCKISGSDFGYCLVDNIRAYADRSQADMFGEMNTYLRSRRIAVEHF